MSLKLEGPKTLRARLSRSANTTIAAQMLERDSSVTKRIAQPKRADNLAAHIGDIRDWLQGWRSEEECVPGMTLTTTQKSSGGMRLTAPSSVVFSSVGDYASWMGMGTDYKRALPRIDSLIAFDARLAGIVSVWPLIAALHEPDFLSFFQLLEWRRDHPDSRPPVRALAIPGLDTKWVEKNRKLVGPAFRLLDAFDASASSALEQLGFDTCDRMTVWFRCGASVGGMAKLAGQFALRPSETSADQFPGAKRAIVVENQTSFEMLSLAENDIAIFGQGGQAPAALAMMAWLSTDLDEIIYWGDMDSEGYHILSRARAALEGLRSVLMHVEDAERHMNGLSVAVPIDQRAAPKGLTQGEAAAYELLSSTGRRIEQERLPARDVERALVSGLTTAL